MADILTRAQLSLLAALLQTDAANLAGLERLGHPDVDVVAHVLEVARTEGVVAEVLEISAVLDGEARARLASLEAWQRIAREAESWAHETPA